MNNQYNLLDTIARLIDNKDWDVVQQALEDKYDKILLASQLSGVNDTEIMKDYRFHKGQLYVLKQLINWKREALKNKGGLQQ